MDEGEQEAAYVCYNRVMFPPAVIRDHGANAADLDPAVDVGLSSRPSMSFFMMFCQPPVMHRGDVKKT